VVYHPFLKLLFRWYTPWQTDPCIYTILYIYDPHIYIWKNRTFHYSLTWKVRPFADDSPNSNHHSDVLPARLQCNLPRYIKILEGKKHEVSGYFTSWTMNETDFSMNLDWDEDEDLNLNVVNYTFCFRKKSLLFLRDPSWLKSFWTPISLVWT